jgi:hypothetical protein
MINKDLKNAVFRKECANNNLERVKDFVQRDTESTIDFKRAFSIACINGSLSIVKYFTETPNIKEKLDLNADCGEIKGRSFFEHLLIQSYMNCQIEIVDYLLFEVKIDVSLEMQKALQITNVADLLQKIEKRDLLFDLSENMNARNKNITKTKI